ncbi:winged helix-turn-helix domain-containing protein [Catenulispora yoronensis]
MAHGLPLSLPERRAAAARIIGSHPHLSDRAIAASVGLAAKTVGTLRRNLTLTDQTAARIGQDGRSRPLTTESGRKAAVELLTQNPNISLREVARKTGISLSTAYNVRLRLFTEKEPVYPPPTSTSRPQPAPQQLSSLLERLRKDPSLRYSDLGKAVLRLLDVQCNIQTQWQTIRAGMPTHCLDTLAEAAQHLAANWTAIAADLAGGASAV